MINGRNLLGDYPWAVNEIKLNRAVEYAKSIGKAGNEQVIKERYIALAGKVIEEVSNPKANVKGTDIIDPAEYSKLPASMKKVKRIKK